MTDRNELERLLAAATEGPWRVIYYDCGDLDYYDHGGPCPLIEAAKEQDCAVVHWDGFKQKYWSSANGNQRQIEANAALICFLRNNAQHYLSLMDEVERLRGELGWAIETLREINPSNYDHDDVCALNSASVEVILGLQKALGETK